MQYSIVYSSQTGNTRRLAEAVRDALPASACLSCGLAAQAADAPLIFAGFWTDKGTCDEQISAYLQTLRGKQVFLFGTAGFGGDTAYFEQILARVQQHLDASNTLAGTFMCQGRMPDSVRTRYEAMLAADPENARLAGMLENFDRALPHPDAADLQALADAVSALV